MEIFTRAKFKKDANMERANFYGRMVLCIKGAMNGMRNMAEGH